MRLAVAAVAAVVAVVAVVAAASQPVRLFSTALEHSSTHSHSQRVVDQAVPPATPSELERTLADTKEELRLVLGCARYLLLWLNCLNHAM